MIDQPENTTFAHYLCIPRDGDSSDGVLSIPLTIKIELTESPEYVLEPSRIRWLPGSEYMEIAESKLAAKARQKMLPDLAEKLKYYENVDRLKSDETGMEIECIVDRIQSAISRYEYRDWNISEIHETINDYYIHMMLNVKECYQRPRLSNAGRIRIAKSEIGEL